jgi:hypothetical protein
LAISNPGYVELTKREVAGWLQQVSSLAVPILAARSCSSTINFSGSMKQDECAFHISFTADRLQSYQRIAGTAMMIGKKQTVAAGA